MVVSLTRRLAPAALAFMTLSAVIFTDEEACASTPVRVQDPDGATCSGIGAKLYRWTPAAGPAARFIADSFVGGEGDGLWVGLGYTEAGFWSAEAHPPDDGCDECATLDVVVTGFDGKRRSFPVIGSADRRRVESSPPGALKNLTLSRLWHLAATDWPAARLQQGYRLRYAPNRDADGLSDPYPGWMVEASVGTQWLLRFAQRVERHVNCWCQFSWSSWSLAAPRKR